MKKILYIALCAILTISLFGCESDEMKNAKESFNTQISRIEKLNDNLNSVISDADNFLIDVPTPLDEQTITNLENAISSAKADVIDIPEMPKELNEIVTLTDSLSKIDYTDSIDSINNAKVELENSIKQYQQVTNPSESFIISRLEEVDGITGISAVTEDNDPNGKLGKDGGYTSQTYFSYELVNQSNVLGSTIIEKGTDCGGSIEVYETVEYANKRNDYLASFDGSIFASGSHLVIGTVLVRTSDELTASQQNELEEKIINALIRLD